MILSWVSLLFEIVSQWLVIGIIEFITMDDDICIIIDLRINTLRLSVVSDRPWYHLSPILRWHLEIFCAKKWWHLKNIKKEVGPILTDSFVCPSFLRPLVKKLCPGLDQIPQ